MAARLASASMAPTASLLTASSRVVLDLLESNDIWEVEVAHDVLSQHGNRSRARVEVLDVAAAVVGDSVGSDVV
jgi:hypothetical protein